MANNYNGKSDRKSNNTYGPAYYNGETLEKLSTVYWDGSLGLTISKLKNNGGSLVEDESNSLRLTVKPYTVSTLASEAEDVLAELKSTGTFETVGIPCGTNGTSLIEISNGSEIGRPFGIYLVLYKDLRDDRTTDTFMVYSFGTRTVVKGYNHTTGAGKVIINKSQEFKDFARLIKDFSVSMNMAFAHAYKEATKYEKHSTTKILSLLCSEMGIDLTKNSGYKNSGAQRKDRFLPAGNSNDVIDFDDSNYTASEISLDIDLND